MIRRLKRAAKRNRRTRTYRPGLLHRQFARIITNRRMRWLRDPRNLLPG